LPQRRHHPVRAILVAGGTITANLAGNAATATTAANVTGNIADAQLSANVARLDGTNLLRGVDSFAGPVNATNGNNVIKGTISGNGAGLTNLPTMVNYVYSFATNTQSVATASTFQDIPFTSDAQISGWTHVSGGANFTNGSSGLYLVEYTAETATTSSASTTVSVRALLNGVEIAGSQAATAPATAGVGYPVAKSFIVNIPTAGTNLFKLQFAGSSVNDRLLPNLGLGTTKPGISMTIIRLQ
jgi:hypothetical protein